MYEIGINHLAWRALSTLKLNLRRLTRIANFVRATRGVVLARAIRRGTRLATQVVFEIDNVAFDVGHGSTTNDAQFHPALVAVLELDRIERVRKRTGALVELLLVRTGVVDEAVVTHWVGDEGRRKHAMGFDRR